MKEAFAAAFKVAAGKFTKFEVTKATNRRLGVELEAPVRQLTGQNINVAYSVDLTGLANIGIANDAMALTTDALQKKVQDKLKAVGYNDTIVAKSFSAKHPAIVTTTVVMVDVVSASISVNMWMATPVALCLYFA
jgi:hypothetical protein